MKCYFDLTKETIVNERKAERGVIKRQTIRRVWFDNTQTAMEYRYMHLQDPKPTIHVGIVTITETDAPK